MTKCKHKGYLDYYWNHSELNPQNDYIEAIFCNSCGTRLK